MSAACCSEETADPEWAHMGAVLIADRDPLTSRQAGTQHERKAFEVSGFQLTTFPD